MEKKEEEFVNFTKNLYFAIKVSIVDILNDCPDSGLERPDGFIGTALASAIFANLVDVYDIKYRFKDKDKAFESMKALIDGYIEEYARNYTCH